jgi:hypothetical protein
MRHATFHAGVTLALSLAAAGCSVNVEGAPCAIAGATTDCPSGQACGNDLRCTARALGCAASRCAPGTFACADGTSGRRCDAGADPVCGAWVADACGAHAPDCRIVADPRAGIEGWTPPAPLGIPQPPECRFGRLGDALDAAAARAPAAAAVRIEGAPGEAPVFGEVTAEEEWPLVVASNVSVVAAGDPPAVIRGKPGVTPVLAVQGTLEGVRVEGGGARDVGIALSCGAAGAPSLRRVEVDGGGHWFLDDPTSLVTTGLGFGVTVAGACGATLAAVDVSFVSTVALRIEADPASAATVEVFGGSYGTSNYGIHVRAGKVSIAPDPDTLASTVVSRNAVDGIVIGRTSGRSGIAGLQQSAAPTDVVVDHVVINGNGGAGVVAAALHSASNVRIARCDIYGNGAIDDREPRYGSPSRGAGGVLLALGPIARFAFVGNRLWSNKWDQLAFDSLAAHSIAAPRCGPDSNVFACMEATCVSVGGACAVAVPAGGAIDAWYSLWPGVPSAYASYDVDGIDADEYCTPAHPGVPPMPTCL